MKLTETTRQIRLQQWYHLIQEQKSSGLTVEKWCESRQISPGSYYYHLKKVREAALLELPAASNADTAVSPVHFAEIPLPAKRSSTDETPQNFHTGGAVVHFGQVSISFFNSASKELIGNLIEAFRNVQ